MAGAADASECGSNERALTAPGQRRECGSGVMIVLSHPTGNANVRQALLALFERQMLAGFYTTIAWSGGGAWTRILPAGLLHELKRRAYREVPPQLVHTAPLRELCRLVLHKTGVSALVAAPGSPFSAAGVYRHADHRLARTLMQSGASAVYAYDGGALETFRAARGLGFPTIYELPTAHTRFKVGFFREEAELQPDFAATLPTIRVDEAWLRRKDEELALADCVIVPCGYVRTTLPEFVPPERVIVVPYGAPPVVARPLPRQGNAKLRVLFVGNLSQGKGISYLLEAIRRVEPLVELTMIGTRVGSCRPLDEALGRYRWIASVPHPRVLEEMSRHDVLAFPSLSEGYGLVVLEALSRGMVVITTRNTGAPEAMRDGREGFFVPIRSAEAIAEKLEMLARDRELLKAMSEAALATARECGWERYRSRLAATVEKLLSPQAAGGAQIGGPSLPTEETMKEVQRA